MGGGGSNTEQQTNSQSVTQLPPWINDAAQQNYAFAQNVANRPLQQYQGQLVPDTSPQMQQAYNSAATGGNAGQDQYNASQAGYLGVMGQQPMNVQAGQLANANLQPYMNPYTQSVINQTIPLMQQQNALQQNQLQNAASSNNAFGGSRQAVQQGVAQAQGAMNIGQMAAQLNQANFGQAQAGATNDLQRSLQAQQVNQQAQQNQGQLNLSAAGGLGTLGAQAQQNQRQNFVELAGAGQLEQQQQQNQINAQLGQFQNAWNYPTQQLGALQSALGMTPYGTATQGQSTTQAQQQMQPDILGSIFSGAQAAGGLFGAGGPFAGLIKASKGTARVPGPLAAPPDLDMMPAALAPGEAVLNREAAQSLGRGKIHALNQAGLAKRAGNDNALPIPGPLAAPGAVGQIGALGSPMTGRAPRKMGKTRFPQVRGALSSG